MVRARFLFEQAAPLIARWKTEREAIQKGTLLPIGDAPDGNAWTGFVSIAHDRKSGCALLFRELNDASIYEFAMPLMGDADGSVEVLGGSGTAMLQDGILKLQIPETLGFLWVRVNAENQY